MRDEEVALENPFKSRSAVTSGQEQAGGTEVEVRPIEGEGQKQPRSETSQTGTLILQVLRYGSKEPVPGARVTLQGVQGQLPAAVTDIKGEVRFHLPIPSDRPATVVAAAMAQSYKPGELRITLSPGQVASYTLVLQPLQANLIDTLLGRFGPWVKVITLVGLALVILGVVLPLLRRRFA